MCVHCTRSPNRQGHLSLNSSPVVGAVVTGGPGAGGGRGGVDVDVVVVVVEVFVAAAAVVEVVVVLQKEEK